METHVANRSSQGTVSNGQPNFLAMQTDMESELERRRKEWEKEVEKMQEDFFQTKINDQNNRNWNINKNVDIQLPTGAGNRIIMASNTAPPTEIGNAKTAYEVKPDGTRVIRFQFEMGEFDPRSLSVRAEGAKLLVTAKVEREVSPGNNSTRKLTRQVDIPNNVNAEDLVAKMSIDGILSLEAPYEEEFPPEIEPPCYHSALEDDDIYFVTRSAPTQENYLRMQEIGPQNRVMYSTTRDQRSGSSPFAIERYQVQSNHVAPPEPRGRKSERHYTTTNTYRRPDPALVSRYSSDYRDPGPLMPFSRGELLRKECPKDRIHHPTANASSFVYNPPSYHSSTYLRDSSPLNIRDYSPVRANYTSSSLTSNVNQQKPKPKVTIIREYETNSSNSEPTSPLNRSTSSPVAHERSHYEKYDFIGPGDKIITPSKYKKSHMSMSQSSDSEASSLSTSPPVREITPRTSSLSNGTTQRTSSLNNGTTQRTSSFSNGVSTNLNTNTFSSSTPVRVITPRVGSSTGNTQNTSSRIMTSRVISPKLRTTSVTSESSLSPPIREITPRKLFISTDENTLSPSRDVKSPRELYNSPTRVVKSPRELFPSSTFKTISPVPHAISPREKFDSFSHTNGHTINGNFASHPNILNSVEGQRLKMDIDFGNKYSAEEITVTIRYKKVNIHAIHEEVIGGRTSRSEFSRDFDIPAPLEPTTVKAALCASTGKLYVGGSLMTNTQHERVLDLVLCDMPTNARACAVKY